ncbi:MAG TPA: DNA polymerase Y family protein [Candidatus Binatia bacterium]|nr:DNA polymerase Y family protein [Candidatus Binatia bacterium]
MDRLACVDLPALPLQLLLAQHPQWKALPACVVDRDDPQGQLLWLNQKAWSMRLRPGMRYGAALSLARTLRAGVVAPAAIEAARKRMLSRLRQLSPHVQASREEPGTFWLDASGMTRMYGELPAWSRAVGDAVAGEGFQGRVVTGFTRFGTYALSKGDGHVACQTVADADGERAAVARVPLERLGISPDLRDMLTRLGVRTVGDFLALPASGIRRRFGAEAWLLHERACGRAWDPLRPDAEEEPLVQSVLLDEPVTASTILLFLVRKLLVPLLARLAANEQGAVAVTVALHATLAGENVTSLRIQAAEATLDEAILIDLVRLRLEQTRLKRGVLEVEVAVEAAAATREQLRIFQDATRRDLKAGQRALARLRAELGDDAVVYARPREGHLPEGSFTWEPALELEPAAPRVVRLRPLVRRMEGKPQMLPPRPLRDRDDSWSVAGAGLGRIESMVGPFIVSGGWWRREVHREYHYARTDSGAILWVYLDRKRNRWFLHGRVE